jgi:hypothetical protein
MNRFAAAHPEDYEERLESMVDAADHLRKERKEGMNRCKACLRPIASHESWCGGAACLTAEKAP